MKNIRAKHFQKKLNINRLTDFFCRKVFTDEIGAKLVYFTLLTLTKLSMEKTIKRKIKFLKQYYKKAKEVSIPYGYISFDNEKLYEITTHFETRKAYITSGNQELSTVIFMEGDKILRFGIFFLEGLRKSAYQVNCEVVIKLELFFIEENKKIVKTFSIPVGETKHGIFGCCNRDNWLDIHYPVKNTNPQNIEIKLSSSMKEGSFLMYENNIEKNIKNIDFYRSIALSGPFISNNEASNKRIVLLSIESLTDPDWISRNFGLNIDLPAFDTLKRDGLSFSCAVSQVDCTRPFVHSMLYGLFSSQHRSGGYDSDDIVSSKLKSIPEMLKKNSFYSVASVPYSHFNADFGFAKGFDSYYCTPRPEMNNAPDMSWILRSIDSVKNTNHFIYSHIQRLHPPMLSLDDRQYPNSINMNDIDSAYKRDFMPIYIKQLKNIDLQIGGLISSLKTANQYDNTMIVILGDHGVGMHPWWKKSNNEYSHFEMRGRVPLFIKHADWNLGKKCSDTNSPVNATITAFDSILEATGVKRPDYVNVSRAIKDKYKEYAIMETLYHPNFNNYAISLRDVNYKFWIEFEVDWLKKHTNKITHYKLYEINMDTLDANEEVDISNSKDERIINLVKKYCKLAESFIEENFKAFD
jgi:hypothetical protein